MGEMPKTMGRQGKSLEKRPSAPHPEVQLQLMESRGLPPGDRRSPCFPLRALRGLMAFLQAFHLQGSGKVLPEIWTLWGDRTQGPGGDPSLSSHQLSAVANSGRQSWGLGWEGRQSWAPAAADHPCRLQSFLGHGYVWSCPGWAIMKVTLGCWWWSQMCLRAHTHEQGLEQLRLKRPQGYPGAKRARWPAQGFSTLATPVYSPLRGPERRTFCAFQKDLALDSALPLRPSHP